jgi:hypothetical protein
MICLLGRVGIEGEVCGVCLGIVFLFAKPGDVNYRLIAFLANRVNKYYCCMRYQRNLS